MKPGGGKQKGAQFERDVCRLLSLWVSEGRQEDVFWRSAMSGGRSTVAHAKGKKLGAQAGDISCIHPTGNTFASTWMAECKFYADLDIPGILTSKGKLLGFWKKAQNQGQRYGKRAFLVAKQNRMKPLLCFDRVSRELLKLRLKDMLIIAPPHDMYLMDFEKFLDICNPPE